MYHGSQLNNSYSQFDRNRQDSYQTARRNVAPVTLQGGALFNDNQPYDTRYNEPMAGTSYHRNQPYIPENGSSYYNQPRRAYPGSASGCYTGTESHDIPQQIHSRYWPTQTNESRHRPTVIFPFNPDSSYRTEMPRNKTHIFPGMQESIRTPQVVMGSNNPMYQNNLNQDYMPTQRSVRPEINSGVPQFNTSRELSSAFKPYRRISPHRQDDDTCRDIFHTKQYNNNTANTERFLIPIRENKISNYEQLDKTGLVPNRVRVVSGNEPPQRPERILQTLETAERECRSNQTIYAKKLAHSFDDASRQIIIPAPSQIKVRHRDHHKHHHHGSHYYQQHQVDTLNAAASGLCHFDQKSYLVQSMSGKPYQEMVHKSGSRPSYNPVYHQMSEASQVPVAEHPNIYPQYLASQQMGYDPMNVPRDLYCTMDGGTYFQITGIQPGENADLLQQACLEADLEQRKEASTCTINTKEENVEVDQTNPHISKDKVTEETIAIDVPVNQSIETMTGKEKASMEYLLELLDQGPESDKIFPNKTHNPDIEKGVMESLSDQVMALQGSDIAELESATPYTFHINNGAKCVDAIESTAKPAQETSELLGTSSVRQDNGLYKSTREERYDIQDNDDLIAQLVDLPTDEEFTTKQMLTNTVKEHDTTAFPLFETVSDYDDFQDAVDRAAFGQDVCSYIDFDNEIFKANNNNEENAISKANKVSFTDTVLVDDLVEINFETGLQATDVDDVDRKNSTVANLQEQTSNDSDHVTNKSSQSYLPRENSPNNSIQDLVTELGTNVSSILGDIMGSPEVR